MKSAATRFLPIVWILAATVILGYPVLRWGLPRGHDSIVHVQWYACFSKQFWQGDLFPRWLASMNAGLGSPSLFVYGPLPYYATSLLEPLVRLWPSSSPENLDLGVSVWIVTAVSGLCAYLWLRTMVTVNAAVAGALVYLIVPYHLSIDLYTRAAVPELWSFAWMPLTLYFAGKVIRTPAKSSMAGLAIAYALLVCTHLVATVLFTPVLLGYAIVVTEAGNPSLALRRFAVAMALGIGLSAVYTLPALAHEKNIPASRYIELQPNSDYTKHFLFAGPERNLGAGSDRFLQKVSWLAVSTLAAAAAAFVWISSIPNRRTKPERFWMAVAILSLCMMLPVTNFIWRISRSLQAVQFPWRYNMTLLLATSSLVALAVDHLRTSWRTWRIALAASIGAMVAVWIAVDLKSVVEFEVWKPDVTKLSAGDYLIPSWAQWSDARFITPDGLVALSQSPALIQVSGAREATFQSDVQSPQWVTLRRLYYPGWDAVTAQGRSLSIRPASATGLIEVEAPVGKNTVYLRLPWSVPEKLGVLIATLSAAMVLFLLAARNSATHKYRAA